METRDIIIITAVLAFLGFRLYQKYVKKDQKGTANDKKSSAESTFFSSSKDDDYEPYSGK
jgi:Tfp pilus assembly major pilin PilA